MTPFIEFSGIFGAQTILDARRPTISRIRHTIHGGSTVKNPSHEATFASERVDLGENLHIKI
jgi:hypothetical protein